jgi:hypothetical protein
MIVSLKVWDDENAESGRIELYNRKSFTCLVLFGTLTFSDKEEKDAMVEMLTKWHNEVNIIPNDMQTGNFVDNYFK